MIRRKDTPLQETLYKGQESYSRYPDRWLYSHIELTPDVNGILRPTVNGITIRPGDYVIYHPNGYREICRAEMFDTLFEFIVDKPEDYSTLYDKDPMELIAGFIKEHPQCKRIIATIPFAKAIYTVITKDRENNWYNLSDYCNRVIHTIGDVEIVCGTKLSGPSMIASYEEKATLSPQAG